MSSRSPAYLASLVGLVASSLFAAGCQGLRLLPMFVARTVELSFQDIRPVHHKIRRPRVPDARLAVLWVGHATVLLQIEDRLILTDPVFTDTVGQISKRYVEPGIDPADLPEIDVVLISHMHFDHLSLGSLEMIEPKVKHLLMPQRGILYLPSFRFPSSELASWQSWEAQGLRVTAVPVKHVGFRYGLDAAWMTTSFTGYVVEYAGRQVYFGGDTAYGGTFNATRERFGHFDLALLPIAPIHPRDFMCRTHLDPVEAIRAFRDLEAETMVPIHFDTFMNSLDEIGEAPTRLKRAAARAGVEHRVAILEVGEQRVFGRRATQKSEAQLRR